MIDGFTTECWVRICNCAPVEEVMKHIPSSTAQLAPMTPISYGMKCIFCQKWTNRNKYMKRDTITA